MVLTTVGYLFLVLCALSVGLFCWLTYSSLTCATRPHKRAGESRFGAATVDLSGRIIGAG